LKTHILCKYIEYSIFQNWDTLDLIKEDIADGLWWRRFAKAHATHHQYTAFYEFQLKIAFVGLQQGQDSDCAIFRCYCLIYESAIFMIVSAACKNLF
jgi:hypothetical protein